MTETVREIHLVELASITTDDSDERGQMLASVETLNGTAVEFAVLNLN